MNPAAPYLFSEAAAFSTRGGSAVGGNPRERYFPGRPDISNMGPLNKHDAFLILMTAPVSCAMPIAP